MKCRNINGIQKMFAVLCMLCIMLTLFPKMVTVNAQNTAKLTTSAITAKKGDTVAVTFNLEGNPGIWGLKFKVGYDHTALTLTSVTNGNVFDESDVVLPGSLSREQFVFLAVSNKLENVTGNGTVVTLNFSVTDSAAVQSYPVTVEITQAINVSGEDVKLSAAKGSVTVEETSPVKPTVKPADVPTVKSQIVQHDNKLTVASPKSGDHNAVIIWTALIIAVGGACCVLRIRKNALAVKIRKGERKCRRK